MGYLKNKYTREYFTGRDKNGQPLAYGAEGYEAFLQGKIRDIDLSILSQINFKGRRVLEFGFGRGEAIKYVCDHGAKAYIGVDFAASAVAIAKSFLKTYHINKPKLYQADALSFVQKLAKSKSSGKFEVVLMLDFIEHVPRSELIEILTLLKKILANKAIIAINTPSYKYDNDVIKEGLDDRNNVNSTDRSDKHQATLGMHCNKYSLESLQLFMKSLGYRNLTDGHFFAQDSHQDKRFRQPFPIVWQQFQTEGYPIQKKYLADRIEYPYKSTTPKAGFVRVEAEKLKELERQRDYLVKLIKNPVIKNQLRLFRLIKNMFDSRK